MLRVVIVVMDEKRTGARTLTFEGPSANDRAVAASDKWRSVISTEASAIALALVDKRVEGR